MTAIRRLTVTKVAVGLVALAMAVGTLFALATPRAQAITLSELVELFIALEVISPDKAAEARAVLSNQGGSTTGGSTTGGAYMCPAGGIFTANMGTGASGAEVMALQKFLNSMPDTQVAASGAGSPGMESSYYGPLTASAVSKFQVKYSANILAPLGLTSGTGYWGASSRAQANDLCAGNGGTTPPPPPPGVPGDDDDDDDDDDLSGGEASLENFDILSDPSDEELDEGDEDVAVMGFEFDVEDGDASVRRVDVRFEEIGGATEDEPWKVFDTVSLWFDGEKIAEMDVDSEDDWDDFDSTNATADSDAFRVRFNNLDVDFDEGDTAEFLVGVTVASNIDDGDLTDMEWGVWIPDQGVRAIDGSGLDQYTGGADDYDTGPAETFTVGVIGEDAELDISTASANPDASTIQVDDDNRTDDVTVLVGDLEAEDDEVLVNKVVIFATTSTSTLADIIADAALEIDGEAVGDFAWDDDCDGSASGDAGDIQGGCLLFDLEDENDEFTIEGDDSVEMALVIDFLKREGNFVNGDTVEFDVSTAVGSNVVDEWDAEKASGDAATVSGSINGEEHSLVASGIFAEIVSTSASVDQGDNNAADQGQFEIEFDVTAFDDQFYIGSTTGAVNYTLTNDAGTTITGSSTAALSSDADPETNGNYEVGDGDTVTFTLSVTANVEVTDFYRVNLTSIDYSATNTGTVDDLNHATLPSTDFRTSLVNIDA